MGQVIIKKGEPVDLFYLVNSGVVKVILDYEDERDLNKISVPNEI
jgi:CRP-like cAMP-binding protein